MCGIAGAFGRNWRRTELEAMVSTQAHRGPDAHAIYVEPGGMAGMAHNRLSIIDLSPAGLQPMPSHDGRFWIVFNGEIYNYLELKRELSGYPYHTRTDTEVILAAYERWGEACLDRFLGMFAFLIWDTREGKLFAARDRFGVKPLNYSLRADGTLLIASEIRALNAAGVPANPDPAMWATYFTYGLHDHTGRTFWKEIDSLPAGHKLTWQDGAMRVQRWYDLAEHVGADYDGRSVDEVQEEYLVLLKETIELRFRSDVPVGINLSGGLDSSVLLGLVQAIQGPGSDVKAFTYITGDPNYDELPWVRQMLARTQHPSVVCPIEAREIPGLAESVQAHQDEPFGGMPTLAYARVFERARAEGVIVLLDGQGMDEQWAGYDYYAALADGATVAPLQGTRQRPVRPECLIPEFRALAHRFEPPKPFTDAMRNRQYWDACFNKIPRALRFNDRISMRSSTELREPFMDHRLFELALRQPPERKIAGGTRKWLLRRIARELLPQELVEAPKRPLQTPQREWLAGPLADWARDCIEMALVEYQGSWLKADSVWTSWREYLEGKSDNSFYIWQWISLGLTVQDSITRDAPQRAGAGR